MTGSPHPPALRRETGPEDDNVPYPNKPRKQPQDFYDLPVLNSMRRTASPSRPLRGRYALGLRPSLDPDAYFDAPNQDKEARTTHQNNTAVGLDQPRSFRNDLRSWHRWSARG